MNVQQLVYCKFTVVISVTVYIMVLKSKHIRTHLVINTYYKNITFYSLLPTCSEENPKNRPKLSIGTLHSVFLHWLVSTIVNVGVTVFQWTDVNYGWCAHQSKYGLCFIASVLYCLGPCLSVFIHWSQHGMFFP